MIVCFLSRLPVAPAPATSMIVTTYHDFGLLWWVICPVCPTQSRDITSLAWSRTCGGGRWGGLGGGWGGLGGGWGGLGGGWGGLGGGWGVLEGGVAGVRGAVAGGQGGLRVG